MKRFASLVLAFILLTASFGARAQTDGAPVTVMVFEAEDVPVDTCWFAETSISELVGGGENYRGLAADLRDAETPIRDYVTLSLSNSEDAIAFAFRDFRAWYLHQVSLNDEDEIAQRVMSAIVGHVLEEGLNAMLPGSGLLVSTMRAAGGEALSAIREGITSSDAPNPQTFLDAVADELEDNDSRVRGYATAMFHDTSNEPLMDQVETIKFEYVMERRRAERTASRAMGQLTPNSCTGEMLNDMGIRRPTPANALEVREAVLIDLINRVRCEQLRGNPISNCETDAGTNRAIARGAARRLILVGRANVARMYNLTDQSQLDSVCPLEAFNTMLMNPDCRRWRASR